MELINTVMTKVTPAKKTKKHIAHAHALHNLLNFHQQEFYMNVQWLVCHMWMSGSTMIMLK
jgi:hypothetical protein